MDKFEVSEALQKLGVDSLFIIQESFLGYKYRKREKKLYASDSIVPASLIRIYYGLNESKIEFDTLKKAFIRFNKNDDYYRFVETNVLW